MEEQTIDDYYNPDVECTCEAIFADTHRSYCKRRVRPRKWQWEDVRNVVRQL